MDKTCTYPIPVTNVSTNIRLENETFWLTIDQIALLYGKSRSTINEYILNVFKEGEFDKDLAMRKIGISDFSTKPINHYHSDLVLSIGYRIKSAQTRKFMAWITERLAEEKSSQAIVLQENSDIVFYSDPEGKLHVELTYEILLDAGKITAEQAKIKAFEEYNKYRVIQDRNYTSDFDKELALLENKMGQYEED